MNISERGILSSMKHSFLNEPIAIIGMSCRFPAGADTLDGYWHILENGVVTVDKIPEERWKAYGTNAPKVKSALGGATQLGSFLSDIEGFDADFFGVSAREAECIDPQQRIILELSWEALEHAGVAPSSLREQNVGVYMAANSFDFGHRLISDIGEMRPWTVNGGMLFGIANRVSYALDFRGPSMTVDTACAGSLTVLHLACQALWQDDAPVAIVGGINVMSNPGMTIALDAAGATAPDGRSKAFDKSADGYGRGEGAGVVVLKRLSAAQRDGDRVLALIRGGGIFQDGRTAGMMAPNTDAQEAMLREIYDRFDVSPLSVSYVEAHGTGTQAGDKAEVRAIAEVFGHGRDPDAPCLLGSAKPNVGHLEAAAGMAGLIKTVLALRKESLPPSVHDELNPDVDWTGAGLKVLDRLTPWLPSSQPRRAGVSCFGVGGTIAHTIVEEAPRSPSSSGESSEVSALLGNSLLFPLSSRSSGAMKDGARRLADWLQAHPAVPLASVSSMLAHRRDHLTKRALVMASDHDELLAQLKGLADGNDEPSVIQGSRQAGADLGVVWVFSGHGAQWAGMAQDLLTGEWAFAETIDRLGPVFQQELGYTARAAIEASDWSTVERIQALTFAVQIGLAALWRSIGLSPGAVIGHSVGEVAASVVGGALSLDEAARFACRRAAIYQRLAGKGAMAMVRLPFEDVAERLKGYEHAVVPAIESSPLSTVISGDTAALDEVLRLLKQQRVPVRKVASDAAFHSPQLDALLPDIRAAAAELAPRDATLPLYTTTVPDPRSKSHRGADFWAMNSRGAVHLASAVKAALDDGYAQFLEVSSAPIVAPSMRETADCLERDDVTICATLSPNKPARETIVEGLARLFCAGAYVDWNKVIAPGPVLDLPTMAWQHRRYWPEIAFGSEQGFGHAPDAHTLLGKPEHVQSVPPLTVWRTKLDFDSRPYPGRHPLFGVEIVPAAALLNTLMTAGGPDGQPAGLKDIGLITPVPVERPLDVQIVLQDLALQIASRAADQGDGAPWSWTTHTTALLNLDAHARWTRRVDFAAVRERCPDHWPWERVEALYRQRGIGGYGFPWHLLDLRRGADEIIASFSVETSPRRPTPSWADVLDGALTVGPLLLPDDDLLRMPSRIDRVTVRGEAPARFTVHASVSRVSKIDEGECLLDVDICGDDGQLVGEFRGLLFGVLEGKVQLHKQGQETVFVEQWQPYEFPARTHKRVVIVGETDPWTSEFASAVAATGTECEIVVRVGSELPDGTLALVVGSPATVGESVEDAVERNTWALIDTAQMLAQAGGEVRLGCLTRGVRGVVGDGALAQSGLWGTSRIIAGERPDLWSGLVDLADVHLTPDFSKHVLCAFASDGREDVVSIGADAVEVLRLAPSTRPIGTTGRKAAGATVICRSDATYLVTGGLGALGLEAAQHLASRGAKRIVLAGRKGLPPRGFWDAETDPTLRRAIERIREMEASGVTVVPLKLDIADPVVVDMVLDELAVGMPPIRGIVHTAGVFEGDMLGHMDRDRLRTVLRPKVHGTLALHRRFPPGSLDFFAQFSSSGQIARLSGQAYYAAANAFLDTLARHRHGAGERGSISLAWMAWRGIGMSKSIDATMMEARSQGIDEIDLAEALAAWRHCEEIDVPYAAIFALSASHDPASALPIVSGLLREDGQAMPDSEAAELVIPVENRAAWLTADVRNLVAVELKLAADDVDVKRSLTDMGVDSLMTVSLRIRLRLRYGFEFPPTLLWSNPSVHAIARYVEHRLALPTNSIEAAA